MALTLASAISATGLSPWLSRHDSSSSQAFDPLMQRSISASLWRITWWSASRLPKVSRSRAHATASSKQTRLNAVDWTARSMRSALKLLTMAENPAFSSVMRLLTGTRRSSKYRVAVSDASQPILSSLVRSRPGRSPSMSSSDRPPAPSGPVRTAVVKKSARMPEVMKVLEPLTTNSSPSRRAVVLMRATSEPPDGSVMARAAIVSPDWHGVMTRALSSSEAKRWIGGRPM